MSKEPLGNIRTLIWILNSFYMKLWELSLFGVKNALHFI